MDSNQGKKPQIKIEKASTKGAFEQGNTFSVEDDKLPPELRSFPIFASADIVLYPSVVMTLPVRDSKQALAIERAMKEREQVIVAVVKDKNILDASDSNRYYEIGTLAKIIKINRLPEGDYQLTLRGRGRCRIDNVELDKPFDIYRAKTSSVEEEPLAIIGEEVYKDQALLRSVRQLTKQLLEFHGNQQHQIDMNRILEQASDAGTVADFISNQLEISIAERAEILCTLGIRDRLQRVLEHVSQSIRVAQLVAEVALSVRSDMDKQQREYFIRQQIKALKEQLGETVDPDNEVEELRQKIEDLKAPDEVKEFCTKQVKRLAQMQPSSAEYSVGRTHLDTLLDIPWEKTTEEHINIAEARTILDEDHYDLSEVKTRIIEHLAVLALKKDLKAPILCFYGPPGVGKTSLGKSIARALGRKFFRISLGGVHDESEIRGHRRTYVASMPGRIVQALRRVQSINPVIMLDEIDKTGSDMRGDPSNALLEVLDPEQNNAFSDNYVEIPIDLSKVLFIATANNIDAISAPLRDRMEIIEITGYTQHDKVEIAKNYLIPKLLATHGLTASNLRIQDKALDIIINNHTREAGVRQLEQRLAGVCRKTATIVAEALEAGQKTKRVTVTEKRIEEFAGKTRYEHDIAQRDAIPGVATGLAWTPVGGEILFIEASLMQGKGELAITGKLGDVMQESVRAALTLIRTKAEALGLAPDFIVNKDLHIHVPAGAIPKDGPSAGVAIYCAMLSLFNNRAIDPTTAMTGEISLRGNVLPVGGIKEKVLAAHRAGIQTIIIPERNRRDLDDIHPSVREELSFHCVSSIDEVMAIVFPKLKTLPQT